jgi:hypothetical protein
LRGRKAVKTIYMPLSFQGLGAVAILGMVLILMAVEGVNYLKERYHHPHK